jgi:hypothetical protein
VKTYAPKGLHGAMLRDLLAELACTPAQAAKFLRVTERSVFRWLADDSAPFAVLAALWHETPTGRHTVHFDVGNEVAVYRGLAAARGDALAAESARLARLVAISDTGAANDPFAVGPVGLHALVVKPSPHVVDLLGGVGGAFVQGGEVGTDGGIGSKTRTQGNNDLQDKFGGEGHAAPFTFSMVRSPPRPRMPNNKL